MLTYLIYVVEDLVATALLAGLALSYARAAWGKSGVRVVLGGLIAGLLLSVVMAVMKQATNMVDTGTWNMRIFVAAAVVGVVFLVCMIRPIAKSRVGALIAQVALALFVLLRVFYKVPDVYLYPFNFNLSDGAVFSTDFAVRITGYLVGIVVVALAAVAIYKCLREVNRRPIGIGAALAVFVIGLVQMMTCLQTMLARRIIPQNHTLFELVKFFSNNGQLFAFVIMAIVLVLAIMVIVMSLRDNEPYSNPAEHRKNKAKWRNRRRWAICAIVCLVLSAATITVIKDYETRGPELSPSEECEIRDGNVYVPLEQVEDGHLHRFTYETEEGYQTSEGKYVTQGGVGVRFIVIKKPGSTAYGIGLDACEICGQTGYYERDGQVVCKLCDVVMNINTIGFKGGCNPIPIEYSISDGYIIVPTSVLSEYEKTFKS